MLHLQIINDVQQCCSNSVQRSSANVLHCVVYGVPKASEAVLRMSALIHNAGRRNAGEAVYKQMVVNNVSARTINEKAVETQNPRLIPNFVHDISGVLL